MNLIRRCCVCDDQATGFHYNGVVCESCKVFFHRNASHRENYKCKQNNYCTINVLTRRQCRKCRLEKCFQNGMKLPEICTEQVQVTKPNPVKSSHFFMIIERIFSSNLLVKLLHESNCCPSISSHEYGSPRKHAIRLSEYEHSKMAEVASAVSVFTDENRPPPVKTVTNLNDVLPKTEKYIKDIIKFCKRLSAFSQLSPADQYAVLKPFCFDIRMIRAAFLFDTRFNGYCTSLNEHQTQLMDFSLLREFVSDSEIEKYIKFLVKLKNEMENDSKIREFLTMYALFNRLEKISNLEFVRYNFSMYSRLLLRYLEHKYRNLYQAKRKYSFLTKLVERFPRVMQGERDVLKRMDISLVPEICIELYDL